MLRCHTLDLKCRSRCSRAGWTRTCLLCMVTQLVLSQQRGAQQRPCLSIHMPHLQARTLAAVYLYGG